MIKLHHLEYSRSTRIIWLLEELGLHYEMVSDRGFLELIAKDVQ